MPADADEPLFDDEFVKGAAFTEPSAQQRIRPPSRRDRRRARRARRAFAGGPRFAFRLPRRRRSADPSHRRAVLQLIAAVAVLLLISTGLWWWNRPGAPDERNAPPVTVQVMPGEPAPGGAAGSPFAGTPADGYADGVAGLEPPSLKPVNGLTEGDMALAGQRVRRLLIAGNLDSGTVFQRRSGGFEQALDPEQRGEFTGGLGRRGAGNTRRWVTSFAAGTAEQAAPAVKVHGTFTAAGARERGARGATVRADHLFVYAIHPPGDPAKVIREVVRRVTEVFVHKEGGGLKIRVIRSDRSAAPAECGSEDGFVRPSYGGAQSGGPADPYDQSAPLVPAGACPVPRA